MNAVTLYVDPPKELFYSKELTDSEIVYYILIVMLSYTHGRCFMSNRELGKKRGKSVRTIQRIIDGLKTKGYIQVKVYTDEGGNSHRDIIPMRYVKSVGGHVRFDVGGMPNLTSPPCQEWHNNNSKENNSKENDSANTDLRKHVSSPCEDKRRKMFEKFWDSYPKKRDKARAMKAFFKVKNLSGTFSAMMQALEQQKVSADWKKEGGRFIPYPTTWVSGERWEDELPIQPTTPSAASWGGIPMAGSTSDETEDQRQARVAAAIQEMQANAKADR